MEEINGSLPEILATGVASAGGIGVVGWWLIKRLIARIDKLENSITSTDPKNPGLALQMALNIASDENFVSRFEDHLKTHKGIKEDVREMLDKFKKDLFEEMDRRYKQK